MKSKPFFRNLGLGTLVLINMLMAVLTVFSAYGGIFNPVHVPLAALVSMFLGPILIADGFVILLDVICCWRAGIPIAASIIISIKPLLIFSPLNFSNRSQPGDLTVLTYNSMHFEDNRPDDVQVRQNATIDFILETDADIVNLQEFGARDFTPERINYLHSHVTQAQIDSLNARYPYHYYHEGYDLSFLSKYPAEVQPLPLESDSLPNMAIYKVNVRGEEIYFYNLHLRSIYLTNSDKKLYNNLITNEEDSVDVTLKHRVKIVKQRLVDKLLTAFTGRTREAEFVRECINLLPGNTIVAGDFNDIPGCYAVRTIMGDNLRDAYADAGLGPVITFHNDRFYFRIDQILYGGNLEAVDSRRLKVPYSDHYPMLTTFHINK